MKTFAIRAVILLAVAGLASNLVGAQRPEHEPIQGAVLGVPTDMFACGLGNSPCRLWYRLYSGIAPEEVNSPFNPADGTPRYRAPAQRYESDAQVAANFPSWAGGLGGDWYIVWDGITAPGTSAHAGWYGAQSNPLVLSATGTFTTPNCRPLTVVTVCFRALHPVNGFNDTVRANGSVLSHVGGISPIPCPTLMENGLETLTYGWEEAANAAVTFGSPDPILGYDLYLLPDPTTSPTDTDLADRAVKVMSLPKQQTMVTLNRASINALPGLEDSATYVAALKLDYAAGAESLFFSCNSAPSGQIGATEPGDAPVEVDVTKVAFETRCSAGQPLVVITVFPDEAPAAKNLIDYQILFDADHDGRAEVTVGIRGLPGGASQAIAGTDVLLRFKTSSDLGDVVGLSNTTPHTLQVVLDADRLTTETGARQAWLAGSVKQRAAKDEWEFGLAEWGDCPAP